MKVLFLNTFYQSGGAAIAAQRLQNALQSHCNVELLTQTEAEAPNITSVSNSFFSKLASKLRFIIERLFFFFYEKNKQIRFQFSPANTGIYIENFPQFQDADIIHLHWINQGFISLTGLKKILALGKPIVITLHDFWYFTGGCHYPGTCTSYIQSCGSCPYLKHPYKNDLSHQLYSLKKELFNYSTNITIVGCSQWLAEEASKSSIFNKVKVVSIPNALPIEDFIPHEQKKMRLKYLLPLDKKIILFGSMNFDDPRKGFVYFKEALIHLQKHFTQDAIEIIVFGATKNTITDAFNNLPFKVNYLGKIQPKDISEVYSIADLYISPSLEDNLPNTVAEAMSCGIPVVAFNTGGLPEMIDHKKNGYLALYKNALDLSNGMDFILRNPFPETLKNNARNKAIDKYNPAIVAQAYTSVYKTLLSIKK